MNGKEMSSYRELEEITKKIVGKYIPIWEDLSEEDKTKIRILAIKNNYEFSNLKYFINKKYFDENSVILSEYSEYSLAEATDEYCKERYNFILTLFRD